MWLGVVLNLTPEQLCQVKLMDHAVAFARTVSGVHFRTDDIAGLKLGQIIIKDKLPGHLNTQYGSDPHLVTQKIRTLEFDWNDFLNSDCV